MIYLLGVVFVVWTFLGLAIFSALNDIATATKINAVAMNYAADDHLPRELSMRAQDEEANGVAHGHRIRVEGRD